MSDFAKYRYRSPCARLAAALLAAGLLVAAQDAAALWGDKLELFASERLTYDDNVFRISRDVDPQRVIQSSSRSDVYSTTSLGFNLNVPWSRQVFQGGWALNVTRFDRFKDLDLTGHDGRALWLWQLGNDLSGQLGYTETKAQASFASVGTRLFDPLTTKQVFANAVYNVTPSWRLRAGASDLQQRHQEITRKFNDVDVRATELGLAYVTAANNQLGAAARREDGEYANRDFVPGVSLVDNAYRQSGVGVFAEWTLSGASHLSARVDRIRREFEQLPQRNFSATVFRLAHDWTHSPKFTLSTIVRREVAPVDDLAANVALIRGVSLNPTYRMTEKTTLSGMLDASRRTFLFDPGFGDSTTAGREDKLWIAALTLSYRPTRTLTFLATFQHVDRSSNRQFFDYVANVFSVSGRIGF
jgi:exopolysaccharide biosynthesis operon protein EpsL